MSKDLFENLFQSTDLHEAAAMNDAIGLRRLLDAGADVNARAFYGTTPLMDACAVEIAQVRKMIKAVGDSVVSGLDKPFDLKNMPKLDPKKIFAEMRNAKSEHDDTPPEDDLTVISLLLTHGADVNAVDQAGHSALMKAVMAGRTETARKLLEHGADLRAQDNDHMTPLMLAARSRRLESVCLLLDYGADPDYRTPQGGTPLMAAADGGRVEIAQLLLARDQDVNTVSVNGNTALVRAAIGGHAAMVAFLKEAGAKVGFLEAVALGDLALAQSLPSPAVEDLPRGWATNLVFWAVKHGRVDIVRLLIERGVDANAANKANQSILMSAVMRGDAECARALLDAGADPNGVPGSHFTPLSWAGTFGYTEIVDMLVERGANANATDDTYGNTLTGAVMAGNLETAKRLLDAGADPNRKGPSGMPLLQFAVARDDKEMVRLLLDRGAAQDRDGVPVSMMTKDKPEIAALLKQAAGTSLHDLAKEGKTAELLEHLDAGADINVRGQLGVTPLIAALRGKQTETAYALIARGADVLIADDIGQTALICIAAHNDLETARRLLEHGATVDAVDSWGRTALTYAAIADKTEMVALLVEAGSRIGPVEAAMLGDLATVRQLLNWGAAVDTRDAGGVTPLMGAAKSGHLEMITALLTRGADINAVDEEGHTALAWAATHKQSEAVRLLLDSGAEVDANGENVNQNRRLEKRFRQLNLNQPTVSVPRPAPKGALPLSIAAQHGDLELARLLLDRGADIDAVSGWLDHTALASAALFGHLEMVRFLLNRGANPAIRNKNERTALALAKTSGKHAEVVALLQAHTPTG